MRTLGMMFLAILMMIGHLPSLLSPGVGLTPRRKRTFADRFAEQSGTMKANQLRDGAGTVFLRMTRAWPRPGLMVA